MMYSRIELDDHIDETKFLIKLIIEHMSTISNSTQMVSACQDLWYYEDKLHKLEEQKK